MIDQAIKLVFQTFCPPDDLIMFKRTLKIVFSLAKILSQISDFDSTLLFQLIKDSLGLISSIDGDEVFKFRYVVLMSKEIVSQKGIKD